MLTSEIYAATQRRSCEIASYGEHILLKCKPVSTMTQMMDPTYAKNGLLWILEFKWDRKPRIVAFVDNTCYGVVYVLRESDGPNDDDEAQIYIVLAKNEYTPRRNDFIYDWHNGIPYRRPNHKGIREELIKHAISHLESAISTTQLNETL